RRENRLAVERAGADFLAAGLAGVGWAGHGFAPRRARWLHGAALRECDHFSTSRKLAPCAASWNVPLSAFASQAGYSEPFLSCGAGVGPDQPRRGARRE